MKPTVIYHSADYDGIFCREISRKFLPDANLIGWNFGDPLIPFPADGLVYVLDLPPDCFADLSSNPAVDLDRIVWIDHHWTSIAKWPSFISGYRIDGVAACRLAWQWFNKPRIDGKVCALDKQDFIDRKVSEPLAVRLAGEYDVWDKRHGWTDKFQYGLRCGEPMWNLLLEDPPSLKSDGAVLTLINQGEIAQRYARNMDAVWLSESWHIIEWEGRKFLAQNSVQRGSGILESKDFPETGHDALMLYGFRGKLWTVSLYHAKHRTDLDLSEIAKKYGGGGHKGACGFTCKILPFQKRMKPTFTDDVAIELSRARCKHSKLNSEHEAYSVILEELDEFWEEVRKKREQRSTDRMRSELVQIAAMAQRASEDLSL